MSKNTENKNGKTVSIEDVREQIAAADRERAEREAAAGIETIEDADDDYDPEDDDGVEVGCDPDRLCVHQMSALYRVYRSLRQSDIYLMEYNERSKDVDVADLFRLLRMTNEALEVVVDHFDLY